jgi:uncharacterized protein (DUF2141 family)
MSQIKFQIVFFLALLPLLVRSQNVLTIVVEDVASSKGYIAVGVYSNSDNFLKDGKEFTGVFAKAEKNTTKIELTDLPNGTYAISIFHDENANKKMDTNFIGIPKESVGFSKGKLKTFGPPSFEECSFEIKGDIEIKIPIN